MALYNNGKRISGIRDFPAYTWAEYHALPVAQRPKVWKCTDRDYTEIPDIFYKDIPIAGLQLSNYYKNVSTGVNPNEYTAIGISDVAGPWDENLTFRVNTDNTLRVLNMRTATYTVPNAYKPIRVYFVKASSVNATPLP